MESKTPLNFEEEKKFSKAFLRSVDWAGLAESVPGRTAEEVEAHFGEFLHQLLTCTKIDLRKGVLWTNEERRMAANYQRLESGNTDARCRQKTQTPAAWRFMEVVTDDLLQEVFLRLPNGGSVIRSTTVCKRWHSLVHKNPSVHNFVTRFIQHHANKEPYSDPTYVAALFRFSISMPFYELSLSTSRPKTYDLSFMPDPESLIIRASCGDLLLLSLEDWEYYICNSVTRHWFVLPEIPNSHFEDLPDSYFEVNWGYALVSHNPVSFSIVIVANSYMNEIGECHFHLILFNSNTGIWTQTPISLQYDPELFSYKKFSAGIQLVCTREGVVHWLDGTREQIYVIAAFDPVSFKTRLIPLPCKLGLRVNDMKTSVQLGVVQGRLRLFLTEEIKEFRFCVQIWELGDARWTLVHDLLLNIEDATTNTLFFVLCLDPYDGNVIYLVHGNRISRYIIGQTEDVGICEFPWHGKSIDELRELVARHLEVLTLVHPPWPTHILSLASSTYHTLRTQSSLY